MLDNVLIGLRRGRLGNPLAAAATAPTAAIAESLLAFVGYSGCARTCPPRDLAARRPAPGRDRPRARHRARSVLLLDEPAAGLMRADKAVAQRGVLRRLADAGLAVILVEHDMALVMGISDHVVVLDAGRPIAAGAPETVRNDPQGARGLSRQRRDAGAPARGAPARRTRRGVLAAAALDAGYGAVPVLDGIAFEVRPGRAGGAARRQRRRQVDHHARVERPPAPGVGLDPLAGAPCRAARGAPHRRAPACSWCPRAARCFPSSACATTSCSARTPARTSMSRPRSRRCCSASRA